MCIKKATIAVSDHAVDRWRERIGSLPGFPTLTDAVRGARVLSKGDMIPARVYRERGITYAVNGPAVFLLRSVDARHFELITVIRGL
jgi:hypothetical protein